MRCGDVSFEACPVSFSCFSAADNIADALDISGVLLRALEHPSDHKLSIFGASTIGRLTSCKIRLILVS